MSFITQKMCNSMSTTTYNKLEKCGLLGVIDFITLNAEDICKSCDIPFKDVLALKRLLLGTKACLLLSGNDVYEDVLSTMAILSVGCKSLDTLLDGGLYTAEVTEIYGEAASGKTQICLSAAVSVAIETEQYVFYIDTGGAFDVGRIQDILLAKSLSEQKIEEVCSRIVCCQTFDIFEVLTQLEQFKTSSISDSCKLLVLDCVAAVVSPILGGSQTDGHGYMMHVSRYLKSLASEFSLAVLVVNNAVYGSHGELKPALGKSWQSVPNTRVLLHKKPTHPGEHGSRSVSCRRQAKLVKSCRQASGSVAEFKIKECGLMDDEHS